MTELKTDYKQYKKDLYKQELTKQQAAFDTLSKWDQIVVLSTRMAKEQDFPLSVLLSQAALESGRGTSYFCQTRNNCFGINAVDANPNMAHGYQTLEQGIQAYINLIKFNYTLAYNNRANPYTMIELIKAGGYASDPAYVKKVTARPEFTLYQ